MSPLIQKELTEPTKDFSLILDDVVIVDLSSSHEYPVAIEAKQVAQRESQLTLFLVENAK